MKNYLVAPCLLLAALPFASATAAPSVEKVQRFDLTQVRLLGGPFEKAQTIDENYLLSLQPDQLLLMFRVTAGLKSNAAPLGGWESPGSELRGHTLGHYLSACSLMYASTGDPRMKERVDQIVSGLAICQQAMPAQGAHPGYVSAFPESFFDRVDAQKDVWAPWYTMHKIMAGLLDAQVHAQNQQALTVLESLAGWVKFRIERLSADQFQGSLKMEQGGMTEVLANLSAVTHNAEYLGLARKFNHQAVVTPLAQGEDQLDGLHANTQIPKIIGAAREYELTGDPVLGKIAQYFWSEVALKRSYALGGDSDDEHFFPTTDFAKHLSPVTAETCNTYNMLKLTEHLFAWDPSAEVMDFYERGLYNQILGSQDPIKGMFTYFVPMKPGHFKTYSTPENSFWCCVGTGMENHAKYGETIYTYNDEGLFVNLFISSQLSWHERGLIIRQETAFPDQGSTRLRIAADHPTNLALHVRQPAWCQPGLTVKINDQVIPLSVGKNGYVTLQREWKDGDQVEIGLPMSLRTEALPGNPGTVAIFYGPILLAGELGDDGLPSGGAYASEQKEFEKWPDPPVPTLKGTPASILASIKPVAGQPLLFQTVGVGNPRDVTLEPLFRLHHQRYTVYWQTETNGAMAVSGP